MTPKELYEVKIWLRRSWKSRLAWTAVIVVDILTVGLMARVLIGG